MDTELEMLPVEEREDITIITTCKKHLNGLSKKISKIELDGPKAKIQDEAKDVEDDDDDEGLLKKPVVESKVSANR
jgi:hypothetical protein